MPINKNNEIINQQSRNCSVFDIISPNNLNENI